MPKNEEIDTRYQRPRRNTGTDAIEHKTTVGGHGLYQLWQLFFIENGSPLTDKKPLNVKRQN